MSSCIEYIYINFFFIISSNNLIQKLIMEIFNVKLEILQVTIFSEMFVEANLTLSKFDNKQLVVLHMFRRIL